MAIHPKDKRSSNPRLQCSVCGKWMRLHCKPYRSIGGYEATQNFFGGCKYTNGDHISGDRVDVCDTCCHTECRKAHEDGQAQAKAIVQTIMNSGSVLLARTD